jgi:DNA-binding GntR family transcriptional regulator
VKKKSSMRRTEKEQFLREVLGDEQPPAHLARAVIEEKLRAAILDGRLPAGVALRQQELATLFGVSRMPVREALRQLEAQSLLRVETHKGAVVAPLINEDATDAYALRILLESEALRQSIPLLTADDIDLARSYIEQLELETDYSKIGTLNRMFHMTLYSRAQNKRLLKLVEDGLNEEERFLRFNLKNMGLGKLSQNDHRELLQMAEAGAVDETVHALAHHLNRGVEAINTYLKSRPAEAAKPATVSRKRALAQ